IGLVVIVIEDLQFVAGVALAGRGEEETAVAAGLVTAGDVLGDAEFQVQLIVGKVLLGLDITRLLVDGEDATGDDPVRRSLIGCFDPLVFILTVEEDHGIGRRVAYFFGGRDDGRHRAIDFGGTVIGGIVLL